MPTHAHRRHALALALVGAFSALPATAHAEDAIAAEVSQIAPSPRAAPGWSGQGGTAVLHDNGRLAWNGQVGAPVRHANGRPAWSGMAGQPVFHANGRLAWSGAAGEPCYTSGGDTLARSCEIAVIDLGDGLTLTVDDASGAVVEHAQVQLASR